MYLENALCKYIFSKFVNMYLIKPGIIELDYFMVTLLFLFSLSHSFIYSANLIQVPIKCKIFYSSCPLGTHCFVGKRACKAHE